MIKLTTNTISLSKCLGAVAMIAALGLGACSGANVEAKYPTSANRELSDDTDIYSKGGDGIFGSEGLFSNKKKESNDTGGNIGVNTFLWRAALDTVSFMPIATADPFGGTIFTDWYEDSNKPGERFKLNVLILDRELRADGIRVSVFKQVAQGPGWKDEAAPADMSTQLEDSILTRARQLRAKKIGAIQ